MKLHLPSGLRKSLLACIAAIAAHSVPFTVSAGSAFVSTGALISFMLSQQSVAEDVNITSKDELNSAFADKNSEDYTWIFANELSSYFGTLNGTTAWTVDANIHFDSTFTVNDGFDKMTQTFNGSISGGADLIFAWTKNDEKSQTWVFNGDMSQWRGNLGTQRYGSFDGTQNTLTVRIVGGEGKSSNSGAIYLRGSNEKLELENATLINSAVDVYTLSITGSASFTNSAGTLTVGQGGITGGDFTFGGFALSLYGGSMGVLTFTDASATTFTVDGDLTVTRLVATSGNVTVGGSGTLVWNSTGNTANGGMSNLTIGEDATLKLGANNWLEFTNLTVNGTMMLNAVGDASELCLRGTNYIEHISDGSAMFSVLAGTTTINSDATITGRFQVRDSANLVINGALTVAYIDNFNQADGTGSISGSGSIVLTGAGATYHGGLELTGGITMQGTGTQVFGSASGITSLNVGSINVQSGKLAFGNSGSSVGLNVTGGITLSSTGALEWRSAGVLSAASLSMEESASFILAFADGIALNIEDISGDIYLTLTGAFTDQYQLFQNFNQEWISLIHLTLQGDTTGTIWTIGEDGRLVATARTEVTWSAQDGDTLTWSTGGAGWNEGASFADANNVTFNAAPGTYSVIIDGNVMPNNVTFSGSTTETATYNFSAASASALNVTGNLTVTNKIAAVFGEGVTLSVQGNVLCSGDGGSSLTVNEALHVTGKYQAWGNTLTLTKGGEIGTLDASWTSVINLGADLVVHGWLAQNNGHQGTFNNVSDGDPVYIVLDGVTANSFTASGNANQRAYVFDGVGLKFTNGSEVTMSRGGTADWNVENLWVSGASLTMQNATTVQNAVKLDGGSITLTDGASLTVGEIVVSDGTFTFSGNNGVTGTLKMNGGTFAVSAHDVQVGGLTLTSVSNNTVQIQKAFTVNGDLEIGTGVTLQFDSCEDITDRVPWLVQETLSGEGRLSVYNSDLTLRLGGSIGVLANAWGTTINLGDDLTIKGVAKDAEGRSDGSFTVLEGQTASLIFDVTGNDINVSGYNWSYDNIGLGVKGGRTLTMNAGTFTTVNVGNGSTLSLNAEISSGSLTGEGSVIGGSTFTLTGSGAYTFDGTFGSTESHPALTVQNGTHTFSRSYQGGALTLNNGSVILSSGGTVTGDLSLNNTNFRLGADLVVTGDVTKGTNTVYLRNAGGNEADMVYVTVSNVSSLRELASVNEINNVGLATNRAVTLNDGFSFAGTLKAGAELSLEGAVSIGTLQLGGNILTVGSNGGANHLSLTSLTVDTGAVLSITDLDEDTSLIGLGTLSGGLLVDLTRWEALTTLVTDTSQDYTFALFDSEFTGSELLNFSHNLTRGWQASLDTEGNLVFHYEAVNVMYWANNADGTWANDATNNWANEDNHTGEFSYIPNYEVIFSANGGQRSVTVSGEVHAKAMTVETSYSFEGTANDSIAVDEALTITGGTTTFAVGVTAGSVNAAGGITLNAGGSLTVKGAFAATRTGMAVTVNSGATLTLEQGGTIADMLAMNGGAVIIGADLTSTQGLRGNGGSITATKDGTSVILARNDEETPIISGALTIGDETHSVGLVLKEKTKQVINNNVLNIHGNIILQGTSQLRHTGNDGSSALQMVGDVVFEGTGGGTTNPWIWLNSNGVSFIDGALTRGGDNGDGKGILYLGNGHHLTITGGGSVHGLYFSAGSGMEVNLGNDLTVDTFHYDSGADNVTINNTDPTGDAVTVTITKSEQLKDNKTISFGTGVNVTFENKLELGTSTLNVGGELVTENELTLAGGTVSVGNGGTISTLTGSGNLTVNGGTLAVTSTTAELTSLTLDGGALQIGSNGGENLLTVNALTLGDGATLVITDLDKDAALISLASDLSIAGNGSLKIDLSGWADLEDTLRNSGEETELSYALFTGLSDYSDLADSLEGLGDGFLAEWRGAWAAELGENGELVFTLKEAKKLYWTGKEGTWNAEDNRWSGSSSGEPDQPFSANCTIVFGEGNADTVKDLTIVGDIVVNFIEVSDTYSFTVNNGEGSLTVNGGLNIEYEKSATFLGNGEVRIAAVVGEGTLAVGAEGGEDVNVWLGTTAGKSFNGNVTLNSGTLTLENGLELAGDQQHDDTGILTLAGGTLAVEQGDVAAQKIDVTGSVVIGGTNTEATLAATSITGNGELANEAGNKNTLDGNAAEFSGTINAAADSTWTLTGDLNGAGEMGASLTGAGVVIVQYDNAAAEGLVISGEQTGQGGISIENDMGANTKLILANAPQIAKLRAISTQADEPSMESGDLIFNNNAIQLGTESKAGESSRGGVWGGDTLVGEGDFILVNGTLQKALVNIADGVSVSVNAHGNVNAGGTASSVLGDIAIHGEVGGRLENVSGGITAGEGGSRVLLSFGAENIGAAAGEGDYLIRRSGDLTVKSLDENDGLAIDLSNEGLVSILENHRQSDYKSALHIVSDGDLKAENIDWSQLMAKTGSDTWTLLSDLGFNFVEAKGGDLVLAGTSKNVYLVLNEWEQDPGNPDAKGHAHEVKGNGVLSKYDATVVDSGETLTLIADEDELTVNNLVGLKNSTLHGKRSADVEDEVTIVLNNKAITGAIDKPGLDHADGMTPDDVRGANTHFEGLISGEDGVNYAKDGKGTLHVGAENGTGGLQLAGDLTLRDGGIVLKGSEKSRVRNLVFAYDEDAEESGMEVTDGVTLTVSGSIAETDGKGGDLRLTKGGSLTLAGESELGDTRITCEGSSLTVNGALRLKDAAGVTGDSHITVNGTLDLGNSAGNSAESLTGSGKLLGGDGSELTLNGKSRFDGLLDGSATGSATGRKNGGGTLTVNGTLDLTGVRTSDYVWNANVQKNGSLTVDVTENNKDVRLNVTLNEGSELNYYFNSDDGREARLRGNLAVTGQAALHLDITGEYTPRNDIELGLTLTEGELKELDLTMTGKVGQFLDGDLIRNSDGSLSVQVQKSDDNRLHHAGMEKNAKAGADLMWAAAEYAWENPETNLGEYWSSLSLVKMMGGDVDRPLAALAGASTSVLGSALSQDIERQLKSIRNRTTMMTDSQVNADAGEPEYHAWISAESGYHKLNADGLAPGFTLSGWGGTVGMDVQMRNNMSVGVAITAMYNDLKTDSADNGRGDIDTTYLSAFARVANGAWTHTFIVSAGMADVTLNRRVNVGGYSHEAHGSTDGYALGALYEVGYTYLMNEEGTFALQPVANIEVRHSSLKGYTESGAGNAGLRVDDISHNVVTVGAGVRMQTALGENAFNRSAIFETRALVKADLGDSSGSATNALLYGGRSAEVESASVGSVGVELGAGVSVPVGSQSGSIFADGSVELRAGYSSMNASAGYRVNF